MARLDFGNDETILDKATASKILPMMVKMQHCLTLAAKAHGRRKLSDMEDAFGCFAEQMEQMHEALDNMPAERPEMRNKKSFDELCKLYG